MKVLFTKMVLPFSVAVVFSFFSCDGEKNSLARELIDDSAITVNWENSASNDISSFQANVSVYSMDNRKDTLLKLSSTYKIATKLIDGEQYIRMDYPDVYSDGHFRSVISNEEEMLVVDSQSEEIEYKIPVASSSKDLAFLQDNLGFGNVNLDKIKTEAKKLAFDVIDDNEKSSMIISIPDNGFSTNFQKRISTKVTYDTTNELLTQMETIDVKNNGATVTTTIEFAYQECDGNYVKVGMITNIDTKYEELVETVSDELSYFNSLEEIPELSESDFEKLQAEGNIFEDSSIKFGNPADLSSSVTIVEIYEDVAVNATEDSVFKLLF